MGNYGWALLSWTTRLEQDDDCCLHFVKRSKSCGCVCLFFFLHVLSVFCLLFVLVVCLRCYQKRKTIKQKRYLFVGWYFHCLYVRPRITDFWISRPSKLPWQHFWALLLVSLLLRQIFFPALAYRAAYLDCIFGHQKHIKCLPRQHLCAM